MTGKQNAPEIRFEGFTDPWEQRKLGELLLFQNGFNGSSESFGSGIPLISVMDVLDDKFITHETVRGKARLNCEEASRYCVEYGDVLFQRSSENQEDVGTSNVYLDQHVSSAFGGFVIRGKKVGEYNPIFIKYLLGSPFIREQITHRAQGAQHINVSQDTLADVVLLMPSMREQEAVGLVFLHLDNLITLHQRKYDKLCTVKKSMLDKMFPKPGETEPEIRFEGFTDPWEQRKLGEVAHRVIRKNEGNQSDLPLTISAQHGLVDQRDYFNNQVASRDMSGYYLLENGEFAYNKSTSGDSPWGAIKRLTKYEKGCLSTLYICFALDLGDPDFLVTYYETNRWHGAVQMIAAEGARNHGLLNIAPDDFFETVLTLPCSTEEQKQIGCFFTQLNSLITLHQREPRFADTG